MAAVRKDVKVSLGPLFNATVNVLTAVDDSDKEVALSNICQGTGTPHAPSGVRQTLTCASCGNDDKTTFSKGRKVGTEYVIVPPEEIAAAAVDESLQREMALTAHRTEDLAGAVLNSDKVYFLEPTKGGEAAYAMFVSLVDTRPDLTFVTVWASRTKPAMYRLTVFGGVLAAQKIAWPGEIKELPEVKGGYDNAAMLAMANTLAEACITDFEPDSYKDTRAETLAQYIAAAQGIAGADVPTTSKPKAVPTGNSLEDMLKAALAASGAAAPAPAKAPAKKAPAKRAPAKKAVA